MKNISTSLFRISCFLLAASFLFTCKNEDLIQRGDTLPTAFKKSMALYQSEEYSDAAEAFETVIQLGRGTDYGQEAQFYLAESYYNSGRYLLASAEYARYTTRFPRSAKAEDAYFKEAYSYYQLSPRYKLDQQHTRTAIEKFQLYNSRYPNSEHRDESGQYITELRSKLAKKLFYSANLYRRTDSYEAAIVYYDLTIDNYPESIWAQRALVDKISTFVTYADRSVESKQRDRYQKAIDAYETFVQLFPEGEYRSEAESHVDDARSAIADLGPSGGDAEGSPAVSSNRQE